MSATCEIPVIRVPRDQYARAEQLQDRLYEDVDRECQVCARLACRYVLEGDLRRAQQYARAHFRASELRRDAIVHIEPFDVAR